MAGRKAARGKIGCEQAGFSGAAGVQVLAHRASFKELPKTRRLRPGIAERMRHGDMIETKNVAGGKGRSEGAAGRSVVPDAIMRRSYRHADAAAGLEAAQHSSHKAWPPTEAFFWLRRRASA